MGMCAKGGGGREAFALKSRARYEDPVRAVFAVLLGSAACLATALTTTVTAKADVWIVPKTPVVRTLDEARSVSASLLLGANFVAETELPSSSADTTRIVLLHAGSSSDLSRSFPDGQLPFVHLQLGSEGGYVIAVDRSSMNLERPAHVFEGYLVSQGLSDVRAERARRGESSKPGREHHYRFAKSLVQVGTSHDATYRAEVGQALELLPQGDPMQVGPGGVLPVLVKFHGQPLAGAKVWALSRVDASVQAAPYVTNDEGIASFPIDRRGAWLVRLTHMVRCEGCADAEWETFWSSYFFATPSADGDTVVASSMFPVPTEAKSPRSPRDFVIAVVAIGPVWGLLSLGMWLLRRARKARA
jgi:hypothetical protein